MNVAHLTSVHPRDDTRVFLKECRSLAARGHNVTLVVADGLGDDTRDGVRIVDVGRVSGRVARMRKTTRRVYEKAVELDCDLYHFHDPELLIAGLRLKLRGKKVIYDAHEDLRKDILSKYYLPPSVRTPVAYLAQLIEFAVSKRLSGVIAATPGIQNKFSQSGARSVAVCNYPIVEELEPTPWAHKEQKVCYVGGLTSARGAIELVLALDSVKTDTQLLLAGSFSEPGLEQKAQATPGWQRVVPLGFLNRSGVRDVMARSMAGLVTLLPAPNSIDSLPIKMFEYMSAGLPVIASDFPLWREIVEESDCGVLVDPTNPGQVAVAIDGFVKNPNEAMRQGENGRSAVLEKYNWRMEEAKLLRFYVEC